MATPAKLVSAALQYAKSGVPEGRSGDWAIERFNIHASAGKSAAGDIRPHWTRALPGIYTRLRCGSVDFMTDLYEEWWSQRTAMTEAVERGGNILITGLGLGMVAESMLQSAPQAITSVTVLEASSEVIDLVGPHLEARLAPRLTIVHADAFTWTPPEDMRYSVAWHDIWPNPFDPVSVTESYQLLNRYAPWTDWQGSWALEYRALAGLQDPAATQP